MKRMILLLSATTLALAPLMSNAKNQRENSDFDPIVMGECSCAAPYDVEVTLTNEDGTETTVTGKQYDCGVTWTDVIGAGAADTGEASDPATYGASFDVEVHEGATEEAQVLYSDIELDWHEVCQESADPESPDICTVNRGDAPFILTNYADQDVTVELYDLVGRRVRVLADQRFEAYKKASMVLIANDLPSGVYFVRITGENFEVVRRAVLTR